MTRFFLVMVVAFLMLFGLLGESRAEKRVALVIGNGAYEKEARLQNPPNDARAVVAALGRLGFDVVAGYDLNHSDMLTALRTFGRKAEGADIGLVYYAGHGLQVSGGNWLLPVDVHLERERDLSYEAVSIDQVLTELGNATKLRLLVLDACRNNPFIERVSRGLGKRDISVSRGLSRIDTSNNTLIAYATRENSVADDAIDGGKTDHSPFTRAFLDYIETPGKDVRLVFGDIRDAVVSLTKGRQEPAIYGSLGGGEVILKPAETPKVEPPTQTTASLSPNDTDTKTEFEFWEAIKNSTNPADYQAYIDTFPKGRFIALARVRAKPSQPQPPPPPQPSFDGGGLAAFNRGSYAESIQLFTKALRNDLSPADEEVIYTKRGQAFLKVNDSISALADFNRVLKLNPNNKEVATLRNQAITAVAEQAQREAVAKAAAEQAQREAAAKAAAEQAQRETAAKAAAEQAQREAAARAAAEQAQREIAARAAAEQARREAAAKAEAEQTRREAATKAAAEQARHEAAAKAEAEQARREAAAKAAAEQARHEAAAKAAAEQTRREAAERARRELAAKATAEKARRDAAAREQAEQEQREAAAEAAERERHIAAAKAAADKARRDAAAAARAAEIARRDSAEQASQRVHTYGDNDDNSSYNRPKGSFLPPP